VKKPCPVLLLRGRGEKIKREVGNHPKGKSQQRRENRKKKKNGGIVRGAASELRKGSEGRPASASTHLQLISLNKIMGFCLVRLKRSRKKTTKIKFPARRQSLKKKRRGEGN